MRRYLIGLLVLVGGVRPAAGEWKPGPAPLMTRWGKAVTPDNAWREYPRPQLVRKDWLNLNGLWDYAITARTAPRPEKFDGEILVPYPIESALSGVTKTVGIDQVLWYRRTVEIPADWKGKRILLNFGAVDWETTVFVNGTEVGTHRGGFDPFSFDVTESLKDRGKQEILIRVWDPCDQGAQPRGKQVRKPGGIWYTSVTGIWQTVWLEPVNAPGHITGLKVTTDLDKNEVTVEGHVSQTLGNTSFHIQVLDGAKVVGEAQGLDYKYTIKVPNARHWTPDTPHLYGLRVHVGGMKRESGSDSVESYFAFRKISVGKDDKGLPRMMLNDKPLFQIGPLDQGWWPDGLLTPPSDEAMAYDLKVLKDLGFNMLRKHIKVEPARLYHHCDRLGLLVWQDMPSAMAAGRKHGIRADQPNDAEFTAEEKAEFRKELKAMIDHLSVFPCIVVWVPFNEGWGQHDTNDILKWVAEHDRTRLVDGPSGWTDRGFGHLKDMHSYPGPNMFPAMPERVSVLGEFGGLGLPLTGHLWKESGNWGYRTFRTTDELRQNYHGLLLRLHPLIGKGLSAAVYTQTTDVEVEINGLMTYDREVIKLDPKETAAWHKALFTAPPEMLTLVETSEKAGRKWRYVTTKPADDWFKAEFDDSKWAEGEGGFGTRGTPGAVVRTEWKTDDIWIRRSFELKAMPAGEVLLRLHHDEDADIYINGVLAARVTGYVTDYGPVPITAAAHRALRAGTNLIAVKCHQTKGGQYIDVGLDEVRAAER
jgi:beta-galactosidase/beta-glucuronidase